MPFHRGGGIYQNEFGPITLSSDFVSVNGAPSPVNIREKQIVTNAELAVLRAVALRQEIRAQMKIDVPITEQFVATTTTKIGGVHRFAKVELVFRPLVDRQMKPGA
jgi:hypothetical protein